jgi:hypothetical protein
MVTLKVADKLELLVRLNRVICNVSMENLGSLGWKTRYRIPATAPMTRMRSKRRESVQHKNLQQQLLLFLGGLV